MSQPLRLLVVDDDACDRRSLARMLRAAPLSVELEEVEDLRAARAALAGRELDLVLLDHQLPDGEGLELLACLPELRESPPPVIVLTGRPDEDLAARCLQAGAQDYLVKGEFGQDDLCRSIRHSLERARLARDLLEKSRELERSNRELARFAAVASHDLQEPLRTVRLLGERLAERSRNLLDERGRQYLDRMIQASGRMEGMIRQLLTLSRVSQSPLAREPVALGALLESVRADLTSTLEQSRAVLEVEPLPTVLGSESQLRRLFLNLIGNALKFRRAEHPPRVRVRALPAPPGAERVTIEVQDDGVGFPPHLAPELFRPFRRLHARGRYPGTGMGLAICQAIVEHHGGEISARSGEEGGASFHFTLPLERRRADLASDARRRRSDLDPISSLVR